MIAKRIAHKGNCQHAQTPYARRVCRKALIAAATTTQEVTVNTIDIDTQYIAAKAIARARDAYGQGAAGFDYMISSHGIGGPHGEIGNEIWGIARELRPTATTDEVDAYATQIREALAGELATYEARCKARKYTGWSYASRGPVRYAR